MHFCAAAGRSDDALDRAFAAMALSEEQETKPKVNNQNESIKDGATSMPGVPHQLGQSHGSTSTISRTEPSPKELSTLTLSMRKLREALIASHRTDTFAQRAYIFIIRACILTKHTESYHPALLHLLRRIHPATPLPEPELHEFVGYYILDLTCRQGDLGAAYGVRKAYAYKDKRVEGVLKALVHDDWFVFWRTRGLVDGYQRRLMEWAEEGVRLQALKCVGRSYLVVEKGFVERAAGGREWAVLKERDGVGWELDAGKVTVRRVRPK
ncbi:hypothetical protein MMC24_001022 [Lignoscripta atroalba]|nr:hypothetical protein [Lignoscripta atroalba]